MTYHTTGFDRDEIIDLCIRINSVERETGTPNWPPCLGLFKSVVATLTYMRHNRTQAEIGESLGVSMDPKNWIGDKGYIGNNMITPYRKPAGGELLDWQKEYNSQVNKIRWMIEQVISHFKNWTIMHTDYRRPLNTFRTTISAVIGLHFYRTV